MKLSKSKKSKVEKLLRVCRKYQGEYLPVTHGSGSWATRYSKEFIEASAELYIIIKNSGSPWPIDSLSELFIQHKILSCRGTEMTPDKVE